MTHLEVFDAEGRQVAVHVAPAPKVRTPPRPGARPLELPPLALLGLYLLEGFTHRELAMLAAVAALLGGIALGWARAVDPPVPAPRF